ncbi:UDP-glucoronosyl and UDP-glucosyl transferase domain-containing protein [Ditylenchus destructor]|nr:UDP-glucoronosyl and UDP-glucosyl transferase domain-containing protein [Ditylenchus destructor]
MNVALFPCFPISGKRSPVICAREMRVSILLIFVIFEIVIFAKAHKLLVFCFTNSKSHMISNGRTVDALSQAGHNVTLLSFEFAHRTDEFHTTNHGRIIRMGSIDQDILQAMATKRADILDSFFRPRSLWDNYNMYKFFTDPFTKSFERALIKDKALIESLRAENFDAIFVEHLYPFGTALGQALGIRTHFLTNTMPLVEYLTDVFGIPLPTGYVPVVANVDFSDQMTILQRAENIFQTWIISKLFHDYFDATTAIFRKHWDPNFGDVLEYMRSSTPLIFVAVSEFMDFPRPIMHNVVYIGGLGVKSISSSKISALPEPFATEMEKGAQGVVFVSFGSNVYSADLPDVVRRNLIDGLAAIHEYHVILKLEKDDSEGIAYAKTKRNIFVTHWAPQAQLLQHSRLKLFFTHGGYNSILEVAQSGKPVLLMPFLYDQTRNAMMVQRNGWGHMFEKTSLMKGSKQLEKDLRMVLEDPKFEQGAKRIQNLLATKPFSADEIFVRNVQFVLDNNGTLPELKSASARLSFIHQFNLDIIILFGSAVLIALICLVTFAALLLRRVRNFVNMKNKVE